LEFKPPKWLPGVTGPSYPPKNEMLENLHLKNLSIQIAGSDLEIIKRALDVINSMDGVDVVDLNCGCPVPKVVNNLQGSALLTRFG